MQPTEPAQVRPVTLLRRRSGPAVRHRATLADELQGRRQQDACASPCLIAGVDRVAALVERRGPDARPVWADLDFSSDSACRMHDAECLSEPFRIVAKNIAPRRGP